MTFKDYIRQVEADAVEAIERGDYDYCKDVNEVIDDMWTDDSITGNGSGSYTFSSAKAKEYTQDLVWDDEFHYECESIGLTSSSTFRDPETCDVTARCLALGYVHDAIRDAWDERNDSEV